MTTKTVLKLEACGHSIKFGTFDGSDTTWSTLTLDGFSLAVVNSEDHDLLKGMAENLAFALKAPERKKRRKRSPS